MDKEEFIFEEPLAAVFALLKVLWEKKVGNDRVVDRGGFGNRFKYLLMVNGGNVIDVIEALIGS